jgi:hypothetical protein
MSGCYRCGSPNPIVCDCAECERCYALSPDVIRTTHGLLCPVCATTVRRTT